MGGLSCHLFLCGVEMAKNLDDYEVHDRLSRIAGLLDEIDRQLSATYERSTPEVRQMIDDADPKGEFDARHWSQQLNKVAAAIIEERLNKDDAEFEMKQAERNAASSPTMNN